MEMSGSEGRDTMFPGTKKALANCFLPRLSWRRRWDSNPRAREGKLISSQPRYDHFDTSPCIMQVFYFKHHPHTKLVYHASQPIARKNPD